jgi:hypothetical protein
VARGNIKPMDHTASAEGEALERNVSFVGCGLKR